MDELIYEFNEMLSFGGLTQVGFQCLDDIYRICDWVIRNQIVSNKRLQLISVMTSVSNLFEKYPKEVILTYNSSSNFRFINHRFKRESVLLSNYELTSKETRLISFDSAGVIFWLSNKGEIDFHFMPFGSISTIVGRGILGALPPKIPLPTIYNPIIGKNPYIDVRTNKKVAIGKNIDNDIL